MTVKLFHMLRWGIVESSEHTEGVSQRDMLGKDFSVKNTY